MANLIECRELEEVTLSQFAGNIEALRTLPKLARLRLEGYQETLIPAEKFWAEFKPEMEAIGTIRLALKGVGTGPPPIIRLPDGSLDVSLYNNNSAVSDLGFLHGLPISRLSISNTKVRDLTPLRGLPLKALEAVKTALTDLEPLRGLPLTEIDLYGAQVPSLAPLQDCPTLESIVLPSGARDIEKLRLLPKLRLISFKSVQQLGLYARPDKTAEQFWKEYDAQQAAGKK
jgi:hypothetical protein